MMPKREGKVEGKTVGGKRRKRRSPAGEVELQPTGADKDRGRNREREGMEDKINVAKEAMQALYHLRQIQKLTPPTVIRKFEKKVEYQIKVKGSLGWRAYLFVVLEDPNFNVYSKTTSILILLLILVSCVAFIIETLPQYQYPEYGEQEGDSPPIFGILEYICLSAFCLEYLLRLGTVQSVPEICLKQMGYAIPIFEQCGGPYQMKWLGWMRHPMNIIDFLAIAPFFIIEFSGAKGGAGFQVLRVLRLTRAFRVFKLGKYSEGLLLFYKVIAKSASALYLLFFFMLISTVVFGSMIYYAERGTWDEELGYYTRPDLYGDGKERSPFTSIPRSFWWVIVTSTTVGYGDFVPRTVFGRIVGTVASYYGILVLAMPLAIISSNFQHVHETHVKQKQTTRSTNSGLSSRMLELVISVENINSELNKVFTETKILCTRYLHLNANREDFPEVRLDAIAELSPNDVPRNQKELTFYNERKLVLDEFRSLQRQLDYLLQYKRTTLLRIKRLAEILRAKTRKSKKPNQLR
uniref:Ion transport domain-containing protein n=1 Tax=Lotharella globosa TaxID=91324 RepID=A0A7S3Z8B0_9EUKA